MSFFEFSKKFFYVSILDAFLIHPCFQIVHGIGSISVYFHQLMGEPNWHAFGYPLLIYLFRYD